MTQQPIVPVSFWPAGRVPDVSVLVGMYRYDPVRNKLESQLERFDEVHTVSLPNEFYLRELGKVDLSDLVGEGSRSLAGFVEKWGQAAASDITRWAPTETGVAPWLPSTSCISMDAYDLALQECHSLARGNIGVPTAAATVAMIRQLRDMVRIWIANIGRVDYQQVLAEWESVHLPPCPNLHDATEVFCTQLSHGLKDLHYSAAILGEYDESRRRTVSLYSAVCAQMYNDIIEKGVPYRTCANETCGASEGIGRQLFKRQRDRGEHGRSRVSDDLKYCTKRCAQAQAAREHRRRQKARDATSG